MKHLSMQGNTSTMAGWLSEDLHSDIIDVLVD
jgi:hypothetical protein